MKVKKKIKTKKIRFKFLFQHFVMYKNDIELLIKTNPLFFFLTILIAFVNISIPIFTAFLTKKFVEVIELKHSLFVQEPLLNLIIIVLIIFLTYFLSSLLSSIMELITYMATEKLDDNIQQKMMEKLPKIDYAEFDNVDFLNDLYKASDYSAEILKSNMITVQVIFSSPVFL